MDHDIYPQLRELGRRLGLKEAADRAIAASESRDQARALEALRELEDRARSRLDPRGPEMALLLEALGYLRTESGECEELWASALALRESSLGAGHPDTQRVRFMLGAFRFHRDDPEGALPILEKAEALTTDSGWSRYEQLLSILAICYRRAGRLDDCEEAWRRMVAVSEENHGAASTEAAMARVSLGNFFAQAGRYAESDAMLQGAFDELETAGALQEAVQAGRVLTGLLGARGELERAEGLHQRLVRFCLQNRMVPLGRNFDRPGE